MSERNLEDEYFTRIEQEQKAKLKAKLDESERSRALTERMALHHHKCGKCGADMDTRAFRGIEIELCPECGAVLLDPGELEALAGTDRTDVFSSFFSIFGGGPKQDDEEG